jgi:predicted ATPase
MLNNQRKDGVRMFKSMRLSNFKGYKDTAEVPLAPLTIIVGANNSGKSTLLQAVLVLAQTVEDPSANRVLVTDGNLVQLNGYFDILHRDGHQSQPSSFDISLSLDSDWFASARRQLYYGPDDEMILADRLDVSFSLTSGSKEIEVKHAIFWVDDKKLIEVHHDGTGYSDVFDVKKHTGITYLFEGFFPSNNWPTSGVDKTTEKVLRAFGRSIRFSANVWRWLFIRIFRAGPLRLRVPWYTGLGASSSSELGLGGANLIAELGNPDSIQPYGRPLVDEVNEWLTGKLGMPYRVRVKDVDKSGRVRSLVCDERPGAKNINAAAMGEGVSQVLPIISRAFSGSPMECLFVEQPEIHLHPALQADLADLFIEVVQRDLRQVVLETHSEHLLLRIRRRIAEGIIPLEKVAILYVERVGSESHVRRLDLNGRGHFNDWPDGFFDEAYQEAMALAEAASRKPRQHE